MLSEADTVHFSTGEGGNLNKNSESGRGSLKRAGDHQGEYGECSKHMLLT